MSKCDTRFKSLAFHMLPSGIWWTAKGINSTYHIALQHGPDGQGLGTYSVLGLRDDTTVGSGGYVYLADARTVCQLDHEARLKEWLA